MRSLLVIIEGNNFDVIELSSSRIIKPQDERRRNIVNSQLSFSWHITNVTSNELVVDQESFMVLQLILGDSNKDSISEMSLRVLVSSVVNKVDNVLLFTVVGKINSIISHLVPVQQSFISIAIVRFFERLVTVCLIFESQQDDHTEWVGGRQKHFYFILARIIVKDL